MTCPRCSGLLVPETVHDGAYSEDLLRCVNCGRVGDAMTSVSTTDDQPAIPRRCAHCKALAVAGMRLCELHLKNMRTYMRHRKLRLDVQARGFKAVLADVNRRLLQIEAQRNFLLANRQTLGAGRP